MRLQHVLSTGALEWNLDTTAISSPYRCGVAARSYLLQQI